MLAATVIRKLSHEIRGRRRVPSVAGVRLYACATVPAGANTHAFALTSGVLWWIELSAWRARLGAIIARRALDDLVVRSAPLLGRGHLLELSSPATSERLIGTVRGPGADRPLRQLASEQFART